MNTPITMEKMMQMLSESSNPLAAGVNAEAVHQNHHQGSDLNHQSYQSHAVNEVVDDDKLQSRELHHLMFNHGQESTNMDFMSSTEGNGDYLTRSMDQIHNDSMVDSVHSTTGTNSPASASVPASPTTSAPPPKTKRMPPPRRPNGPRLSSICHHNKRRSQCVKCYDEGTGGSTICEHRRQRYACRKCFDAGQLTNSLCVHRTIKIKCKECTPVAPERKKYRPRIKFEFLHEQEQLQHQQFQEQIQRLQMEHQQDSAAAAAAHIITPLLPLSTLTSGTSTPGPGLYDTSTLFAASSDGSQAPVHEDIHAALQAAATAAFTNSTEAPTDLTTLLANAGPVDLQATLNALAGTVGASVPTPAPAPPSQTIGTAIGYNGVGQNLSVVQVQTEPACLKCGRTKRVALYGTAKKPLCKTCHKHLQRTLPFPLSPVAVPVRAPSGSTNADKSSTAASLAPAADGASASPANVPDISGKPQAPVSHHAPTPQLTPKPRNTQDAKNSQPLIPKAPTSTLNSKEASSPLESLAAEAAAAKVLSVTTENSSTELVVEEGSAAAAVAALTSARLLDSGSNVNQVTPPISPRKSGFGVPDAAKVIPAKRSSKSDKDKPVMGKMQPKGKMTKHQNMENFVVAPVVCASCQSAHMNGAVVDALGRPICVRCKGSPLPASLNASPATKRRRLPTASSSLSTTPKNNSSNEAELDANGSVRRSARLSLRRKLREDEEATEDESFAQMGEVDDSTESLSDVDGHVIPNGFGPDFGDNDDFYDDDEDEGTEDEMYPKAANPGQMNSPWARGSPYVGAGELLRRRRRTQSRHPFALTQDQGQVVRQSSQPYYYQWMQSQAAAAAAAAGAPVGRAVGPRGSEVLSGGSPVPTQDMEMSHHRASFDAGMQTAGMEVAGAVPRRGSAPTPAYNSNDGTRWSMVVPGNANGGSAFDEHVPINSVAGAEPTDLVSALALAAAVAQNQAEQEEEEMDEIEEGDGVKGDDGMGSQAGGVISGGAVEFSVDALAAAAAAMANAE